MAQYNPPTQVNISSLTIVKIILVVVGLAFLWSISDILAMIFVAYVLASALDPMIDRLQRYKIPRAVSILTVYVIFLSALSVVIALLVPSVSHELSSIARDFPSYYEPISNSLSSLRETSSGLGLLGSIQDTLDGAVKSLTNLGGGLYSAVASLFGGVITFIGILVIAFYMTVEEDSIKKFVQSVSPINYQPYIIRKVNQIQVRLSSWLWGQVLLMVFVGLLAGISLWILGVKYWLVLGILAGLLEFIPIVGPVLAAIPAVFFAFTDYADAPYKPFLVILIFIIIQQVENHVLVPRIMRRAVGLNPIVIIISLLVGARLGGLVGVILAVPLITIVNIFLDDFFEQKKVEQNKLET